MQKNYSHRVRIILFPALALTMAVAGACSSAGAAGKPAQAVESYLQALAARDENQVVAASCGDWEAQARQEFISFSAVTLELQDVACAPTGQDGAFTLVDCTGKIIANYGAEDVEIDIAGQTYRVLKEGGAWRVCGYQQ